MPLAFSIPTGSLWLLSLGLHGLPPLTGAVWRLAQPSPRPLFIPRVEAAAFSLMLPGFSEAFGPAWVRDSRVFSPPTAQTSKTRTPNGRYDFFCRYRGKIQHV